MDESEDMSFRELLNYVMWLFLSGFVCGVAGYGVVYALDSFIGLPNTFYMLGFLSAVAGMLVWDTAYINDKDSGGVDD